MIIHIRKVENGYVITQERDAALISPQPPTFVAEHEADAHCIVGELLGVLSDDEAPSRFNNISASFVEPERSSKRHHVLTTDFGGVTIADVESARLFIDRDAPYQARAVALKKAFPWNWGPQGLPFWGSIYDFIRAGEKHPQLDAACEIVARSIEEYERENS